MESNFEFIVLRNLLQDEFFSRVIHILKPQYFTKPGTGEMLKLFKEYYTEYNKTPEIYDLIAMIKDVPSSETRKNLVDVAKTMNGIKPSDNVKFLCDETLKFCKDALYFEALMVGSEGLQKRNDGLKLKAESILDERAKLVLDESLGIEFTDVDDMISYFSERNYGILSQHAELNKRLGSGFLPGTLSVICAAQGVGKSLMMCDLISGFIQNNKNVLLVSLEMSEHEMMRRIYANVLNLDVNHLLDLSKTPGELQDVPNPVTKEQIKSKLSDFESSGNAGRLFVKEYPTGTFSAIQLESLVKKYKQQRGVEFDVVLLDYLGIAKSDRVHPGVGLYSYVKSIAEEFRAAALNLGVSIISASQLNRASINQIEGVDNSNMSDSLGIAMTVDFCMLILQDEEMKRNSQVVVKVTKNRFNGRTDQWMMDVDYSKMRFKDHQGINGSTFDSSEQQENIQKFTAELDSALSGLGL